MAKAVYGGEGELADDLHDWQEGEVGSERRDDMDVTLFAVFCALKRRGRHTDENFVDDF